MFHKKKAKGFAECFGHTRRRMYERYGVQINEEQYRQMVAKIKRQESQVCYKQSLTRVVHKLEFLGKRIIVIYDKSRKLINTALPTQAEFERRSRSEITFHGEELYAQN